jgi:hypothetical protein
LINRGAVWCAESQSTMNICISHILLNNLVRHRQPIAFIAHRLLDYLSMAVRSDVEQYFREASSLGLDDSVVIERLCNNGWEPFWPASCWATPLVFRE